MKEKSEWDQHSIAANVRLFLKLARQQYPLVFIFFLVQVVLGAVLPLFGLFLPRLALQLAMANQGPANTMITLGLFAGVYVLLQAIHGAAEQGKYPIQNIMRNLYYQKLFTKALDCDYQIMETSEGRTWYQKAWGCIDNGDESVTYQMINTSQNLISGIISFSFLAGILSMLSPYVILLLVVLSAFGFFIDGFPRRFEEKQRDLVADTDKKIKYVETTMADISAAKDMRLYPLPVLIGCNREWAFKWRRKLLNGVHNRYFLAGIFNGCITIIRDGFAYAYCIWQVLEGNITVPDFVLFMGAINAFSGWLVDFLKNVTILKRENVRANELRAFLDYSNMMDPAEPIPVSVLGDADISVEFRNVSFRYTKETPYVLENLSFYIGAKERVALVGVNGAGKTTIVKLLCGFYKTTEGEVLINGHNIDHFTRADLYSMFSVVFQDICIMPISVTENVTLKVPEEIDEKRVIACLEQAGILDSIMEHPQGLKASMTKSVDSEGLILSGGQQQKLILARALYKNAPIMILDEPTSALDPMSESEIYKIFNEMTVNKTVLYISHRLASTRFCDKIIMLEKGRIIEMGNHVELMAKKGSYAHMYEIQSHYYKDTVEEVLP